MISDTTPVRRWLWLSLVMLLLTAVVVAAGTAVAAATLENGPAAPTHTPISGTVTDPDGGLPPAGTIVKLVAPGGNTHGQAMVDPASGSFSFGPVPNGNYVLQAWPPPVSGLTPSLPEPLSVTGLPIDVGTMALTRPTLFGTVYAPDGVTPVDAHLHVRKAGHLIQVSPAPSGTIQIGGLLSATYSIQAEPAVDLPLWQSPAQRVTVTTGVSQTVDFVLRPANVAGTVTDPNGTPVPGATVHVVGLVHHTYRSDVTSGSGYFAIGDLRPDVYTLIAEPPWFADGLIAAAPVEFTVPPSFTDLGSIALRAAPKVVEGLVETNAGAPVENALIVANRLGIPARQEALTGANGRYHLRLSGGLWSITVRRTDSSNPGNWLYPHPPQYVHFDHDLQPEQKTVNFEVLTADATVTGEVQMPDGSTPPFTVTVGLRTPEGHGRWTKIDPATGGFTLTVPHGNYVLVTDPADPAYFGSPPQPVYAPVSATLDAGILTLVAKDASLGGLVTDEDGQGVAGIRVTAWSDEHLTTQTETGPDGRYRLAVSAGTWRVRSHVPPNMPYLAPPTTYSVTLSSGQHTDDLDFVLETAANLVRGQLVDPNGHPVNASGWAAAGNGDGIRNGAPIVGGSFGIYLPDGDYQLGIQLATGSGWLAGPPQPVSVSGGSVVTVAVPLQPQDATVVGALWDPRAEVVVTGVAGHVRAADSWTWVGSDINTSNGTYHLGLGSGLWRLGYGVDPRSGYVTLDHHKVLALESQQTLVVPLPVAQRDAIIEGVSLDPSGQPLPGAVVAADGMGPVLEQVTLRTMSGADGSFRLPVPHGRYRVRAHIGHNDWLNPVARTVAVPADGSSPPVMLQFLEPDVTLSGTVSIAQKVQGHGRVHIWAYSDAGVATHTASSLNEPYELGLLSGNTWHVGAVLETPESFYAVRESLFLTGNQTLDLELAGPYPKPAPVVVTFDAALDQTIHLADGTFIFIPGGAMPVQGNVTLHITPIATFPHQHHARLYKYGYAFIATDETGTPITSSFNQNVVISFAYDENDLHHWNLLEEKLKPAYYSTTTQSWTIPESYIVDTDANRVLMEIDHFTDFSLLNNAFTFDVYLPLVLQ